MPDRSVATGTIMVAQRVDNGAGTGVGECRKIGYSKALQLSVSLEIHSAFRCCD
jgi:hypothetical protein